MNKEEKEKVENIKWNNEHKYCNKDDVDFLLNLIQKQEKIIDRATEVLEEAKLSYFTKEDGGELIGQYRCFNKDDWKKYLKKEVEKDVKD
jgi:hypothetical protein